MFVHVDELREGDLLPDVAVVETGVEHDEREGEGVTHVCGVLN